MKVWQLVSLLLMVIVVALVVAFAIVFSPEPAVQGLVATPEAILLSKKNPAPNVQNGWAFDKGTFPIEKDVVLVIPTDARVELTAPPGTVEVFMEKTWTLYQTIEDRPLTIQEARSIMGCALRKEEKEKKIVLGTYGEWDDTRDGSGLMALVIRVPEGTVVEPRPLISGPYRKVRGPMSPPNPEIIVPGEGGWEALKTVYDPALTAKFVSRPYE